MHVLDSLYGKLVALLLAVLAIVGTAHIALTLHAAQRYFQEVTQEVNHDVADKVASHSDIRDGNSFDRAALKQLFSDLMTTHQSIEVYALDPSGVIEAFSAPPGAVVRRAVALDPIEQFLSGKRFPILGDDPRTLDGRKVFSVATVPISGTDRTLAGYIYVVLEGQLYESAVQRMRGSYILRQSSVAAGAGLAFALIAALFLLRLLMHPLRRLASAMQSFEHSGFAQVPALTVNQHNADEIGRLENAFAAMAKRMGEQVTQIRSVDSIRRELLANVSHDLRTPLASLRGYLDTVLLREDRLSQEEQREFLRIAARHAESLGKHIDDLFELARLDTPHMTITREPVSLAELVQDSLQRIRLPAEEKGIHIEAHLTPGLPAVNADLRLIARVIDNLLDNAVRHTPRDGKVTASVQLKEQCLTVCVADTGCGISPEDLERIFNRFYQARDTNEPVNGDARRAGLGLGLAIAKQILDLHGACLSVSSTLGAGTRFEFALPTDK